MTQTTRTLTLILTLTLSACATSLRDDLDDHPNGRFAEAASARAPTPAPAPAPTPEPAPAPTPEPAPAHTPTPAPPDNGSSRPQGEAGPEDGGTPSPGPAKPSWGESDTAPAPAPTPTPAPAPAPAPAPVLRGPITAADLAVAGVSLDDSALAPFRDAWRPSSPLRYGDARLAFLARSPAIAEAVQRFRASFERYGQIAALDDLVRQYDAFAKELKTGATTPILMPSLARRFPFGGVAALQGRLAEVDVALARATLERELLTALAEFESVYHEALYWQHAAAIIAEVDDLADRVVEAARARYGAGGTSHANLIQAEIREEALSVRLGTARARRTSARTALAAALDVPAAALARSALALDARLPARPRRAEVAAGALAHGPQVAAARLGEERATLMVQLAERQLQPNLAEGATTPGSGPRPPAADLMYATGGPFLREIRVRAEAAAAARADAERQVPARADQAWVTLDDALRRRASAAGHQLARARQGVDVAELGYRAGTASFFDLDSAVQLYLATALDARAALRDAHLAAARLAIITGTGAATPLPTEDPDE